MLQPHNTRDPDSILSSGESAGLDFIQGFEKTWSNYVACTKTICGNVVQFIHLKPTYTFELGKFNELFFFIALTNAPSQLSMINGGLLEEVAGAAVASLHHDPVGPVKQSPKQVNKEF